MELQNARILITGGSAGIGHALARLCTERDARVVINGRDGERLDQAGKELGVATAQGDVGKPDDARRIVNETVSALGGLDVLVNNAAWGRNMPLEDLDPSKFMAMIETNVLGSALMAHASLPHLERAGGGSIVNVSSTAGKRGYPGGSAYAGSKFALDGMSQCWQMELRRRNIRVMVIHPSEVQTGFGGPFEGPLNPRKLVAEDIAHAIRGALEMDNRGFIPELSVYATNPFSD